MKNNMSAAVARHDHTGRITSAPSPIDTPKRTRLGSVHRTGRTTVRANCGCGWTVATTTSKGAVSVFEEAIEHNVATGHAIDILGIIR
jgi:hypothetical protein